MATDDDAADGRISGNYCVYGRGGTLVPIHGERGRQRPSLGAGYGGCTCSPPLGVVYGDYKCPPPWGRGTLLRVVGGGEWHVMWFFNINNPGAECQKPSPLGKGDRRRRWMRCHHSSGHLIRPYGAPSPEGKALFSWLQPQTTPKWGRVCTYLDFFRSFSLKFDEKWLKGLAFAKKGCYSVAVR